MRLASAGNPHLTYCTNIHPGETWDEVKNNLERHVLRVKAQVAPDRPFGVGLRLSAIAAEELSKPGSLEDLTAFLGANGLYVFTINGFPYGPFHGVAVKENVYLPDWLDPARLVYTDRLAAVLARLLPADAGLEGTISTSPGAFKTRVKDETDATRMADAMLRHVTTLVRIREQTGKVIALAIEPEPCCYVETIAETTAFFDRHLFSRAARDRVAGAAGLSPADADEALRRHLTVCFDACHMAVEFEDPRSALRELADHGIRIGKFQISAGLSVRLDEHAAGTLAALAPFAEGVYLHQVVQHTADGITRYVDLPQALAAAAGWRGGEREWRVHFHVPLFREQLGAFVNTQAYLRQLLGLLREHCPSQHLEVETYTWDVLPEEYRREDIATAIARELAWVQTQLTA